MALYHCFNLVAIMVYMSYNNIYTLIFIFILGITKKKKTNCCKDFIYGQTLCKRSKLAVDYDYASLEYAMWLKFMQHVHYYFVMHLASDF